jgi:hypothetical protein
MDMHHWALIAMLFLLPGWIQAQDLRLVGKETFVEPATPGVRLSALAFYRFDTGSEMLAHLSEQNLSDKANIGYRWISSDNGQTWTNLGSIETHWPVEGGTLRRGVHPLFTDTGKPIQISFINQGIFPSDDPLEGMWRWTVRCAYSRDGGLSFFHEEQVVQKGEGFSEEHPLEGVTIGKTSYMMGDTTCRPIRLPSGEILQPIQITPAGPDGGYHNPGNGYTYHDSAVLIGTWNEAGTLDWELSERVVADPNRSSRGMLEPTIARVQDGRILMVMRGSNDRIPEAPSFRWRAVSEDDGKSWSVPEPWTYDNDTPFFSPSSCSQLLTHSTGRLFWIGNICEENAQGNAPRYPLLIGEVDRETLKLAKESLCVLDDKNPEDWERLAISNFYAHEDRVSGEIVVYCSPLFRIKPKSEDQPLDWSASAYKYRVSVGQ